MPLTFDSFTLSNAITDNHYLIGYTDTNSGGEKRWTLSTIKTAVLNNYSPTPSPGNGLKWLCGHGTPEGYVVAPMGSLYSNIDGGSSTLYVKQTGTGATGWIAK